MATVRISQLTAITAPTDDDVLIINDADTNTRKITYANLTQNLLNTSATSQTKTGALTVSGTLTAGGNLVVDTNTLFVDANNNRVGIKTTSPATELDVDGTMHIRNANVFQFGDANDSNYVGLKAPSVVASDFTLTLPSALPGGTELVTSTSAGVLGFTTGITASSGTLALSQVQLSNQGSVRFYEATAGGSEYVEFSAPATLAGTNSYTLPSAYPASSGFVLSSSTAGVLSWVSNAAGAAGADSQVQFATSGVLDSSANFTFQTAGNLLTVTNATVTGNLLVQGGVDLGNASADLISIVGEVDTDIIPNAGTETLGSATNTWAEAHVEDLHVGTSVSTSLIPTLSNTEDLGSSALLWREAHVSASFTGAHARETGNAQAAVASAGTFPVVLGTAAGYGSFKVLVQATDDVTGDREFYEQIVTHDGSVVQEMTGSNVQSPTPGTFLTTPATAIAAGNVVLTLTNSAASGNAVSMRVLITAIAL